MDDLCVVTCYYNPEGYRTKLYNYLMFEDALRSAGLNRVTVECSMGQMDYELPDRASLVRVRGRDPDVEVQDHAQAVLQHQHDQGYRGYPAQPGSAPPRAPGPGRPRLGLLS